MKLYEFIISVFHSGKVKSIDHIDLNFSIVVVLITSLFLRLCSLTAILLLLDVLEQWLSAFFSDFFRVDYLCHLILIELHEQLDCASVLMLRLEKQI